MIFLLDLEILACYNFKLCRYAEQWLIRRILN